MRYSLNSVIGVLALTAGSISIEAADYADVSTDELVEMRTQARDFSTEDRDAFRSEMQGRMQSMSTEERALYQEMNGNRGQGQGDGTGKMKRYGQGSGDGSGQQHRYGQGSGDGSGQQHRYGQGNSNGEGSMNRYGQGGDQGYGSGYGSRQGGGGRRGH